MIVYDLACANKHTFEGWFGSSRDFEQQLENKQLSCPLCGDNTIVRVPSASYLNTRAAAAPKPASVPQQQYTNMETAALAKLIDRIVETTEDVGAAFPEEARKIHYGESTERPIRGTASPKEVEALRDEGIEVVALPVPPHRLNKSH